MNQVVAKLNYLRIAPRKVRLLAAAIKGLSVNEAEAQLLFRPQRAGQPLLGLLRSAIANAKNNHKMSPEKLMVKNIWVDQGPTLKRFLPRAMGRATSIHKKTSHVVIILEERANSVQPRFQTVIGKKTKSPKKTSKTKAVNKKVDLNTKSSAPVGKPGFFKKLFNRKTGV